MTHAEYAVGAAVPALTWGKLQNGVIPVAGRFNHAFVDGLHASRFYALVEEDLLTPSGRLPLTETAPPRFPSGEGALTSARTDRQGLPPAHGGRYGGYYHRSLSAANTAQGDACSEPRD